jgi:hypothetical protein
VDEQWDVSGSDRRASWVAVRTDSSGCTLSSCFDFNGQETHIGL